MTMYIGYSGYLYLRHQNVVDKKVKVKVEPFDLSLVNISEYSHLFIHTDGTKMNKIYSNRGSEIYR